MTARAAVFPLVCIQPQGVQVQDDEGFAVIWRNGQRARNELLGGWILRVVGRLWKLSHVGWFKLGTPRLPSAERGGIHASRLTD